MHRSGTSLIASWLQKCGLVIHDGNLMGPSISNPKGYFEDSDFIALHGPTMYEKVPKSDSWKVFSDVSLKFSQDKLKSARMLAEERNSKYPIWGWKDPRTVFFLDQWKQIIPDMKVLLVWRPCPQTAYSLMRRKKTAKVGLTEPVRLWISYNKKVCEYKEKHPDDTLLLPLDYIIKHDKDFFSLLNEKLKIGLKYSPISTVYERKLLNKKPNTLIKAVSKMIIQWHKSGIIKEELINLSDKSPSL